MSRILVHSPSLTRRRPMRARRAIARDLPVEYSPDRLPPRWLVVGTGLLGAITVVLFLAGVAVIA